MLSWSSYLFALEEILEFKVHENLKIWRFRYVVPTYIDVCVSGKLPKSSQLLVRNLLRDYSIKILYRMWYVLAHQMANLHGIWNICDELMHMSTKFFIFYFFIYFFLSGQKELGKFHCLICKQVSLLGSQLWIKDNTMWLLKDYASH